MMRVEKQTRLDCTQLHQSSVVGRTLKVSLSLHDSIMRAIRTVQLETILSRWDMSHSCQPMWMVHISECGYTYIQYIHTYPNSSLEMCWPNVFHHGHFPRFNQLNCLTDGYILPRDKQATMLCSIQWCFCVVWSMVVSLLCYSPPPCLWDTALGDWISAVRVFLHELSVRKLQKYTIFASPRTTKEQTQTQI